MGVVYSAQDVRLKRDVALKYLLPEFAGKTLVEARFNYEARITARLQHPGIPPVHEVGTAPMVGRSWL
jgi:serine/threonine protein kinase